MKIWPIALMGLAVLSIETCQAATAASSASTPSAKSSVSPECASIGGTQISEAKKVEDDTSDVPADSSKPTQQRSGSMSGGHPSGGMPPGGGPPGGGSGGFPF
jgi:uncharacterized membrane protein YgcG